MSSHLKIKLILIHAHQPRVDTYLILSILISHLSLADYIIRRVIPEERNPRTTPHRPPACPGAEPPSLEILFSFDSVIAFRLPISFLPFCLAAPSEVAVEQDSQQQRLSPD